MATGFSYSLTYSAALSREMSVDQLGDVFIDGAWQRAHSRAYLETTNPATEKRLADVVDADAVDIDSAVTAAHRAFQKLRIIRDELVGPVQ